jgi:hypothetical protein
MFNSLGSILIASSMFGILYGFFRLFGAKGGAIEAYYQNVPLGLFRKPSSEPKLEPTNNDELTNKTNDETLQIISPEKLIQYAGLLLILTAFFSMLFRINWELENKIAASFIVMCLSIWGAYKLQNSSDTWSSVLELIGFAALQFNITLISKWLLVNQVILFTNFIEIILSIKLLLAALYYSKVLRTKSGFTYPVFFLTIYLGPTSLTHLGLTLNYIYGLIFVLITSAFALNLSIKNHSCGLMIVNLIAAAYYISNFITPYGVADGTSITSQNESILGLVSTSILFIAQITTALLFHLKHKRSNNGVEIIHLLLAHLTVILLISSYAYLIPPIYAHIGLIFVIFSIIPGCAYFKLQSMQINSRITSCFLNCSIAISSFGLIIETSGPWSAIVFLGYSCLILWYSILQPHRQLRLFALLMLILSIFKLYFECSKIFNSLSGSAIILLFGVLLLLIANKIERIKQILK